MKITISVDTLGYFEGAYSLKPLIRPSFAAGMPLSPIVYDCLVGMDRAKPWYHILDSTYSRRSSSPKKGHPVSKYVMLCLE